MQQDSGHACYLSCKEECSVHISSYIHIYRDLRVYIYTYIYICMYIEIHILNMFRADIQLLVVLFLSDVFRLALVLMIAANFGYFLCFGGRAAAQRLKL